MPPRWLDQSDLEAVGEAETMVDLGGTHLLGLHVTKTRGGTLGMLAVKCLGVGDRERPMSMAITDTPIVIDTTQVPMQSNPIRRVLWRGRETGDDR